MGVILTPQKWFRFATPSRLLFGDAMEGKQRHRARRYLPSPPTGSSTGTIEVVGIAIDAFRVGCVLRPGRRGQRQRDGKPGAADVLP